MVKGGAARPLLEIISPDRQLGDALMRPVATTLSTAALGCPTPGCLQEGPGKGPDYHPEQPHSGTYAPQYPTKQTGRSLLYSFPLDL